MVSNGIRVYMTCPPEGYCPRRHFSIRSIDKIRSLGDLILSYLYPSFQMIIIIFFR